ncbi:MAG: hypothetical protein GY909_01640 [Oligoflexia bacterium]|nr:hypothetical protein [Oligoflexia bacterium]
MKKLFLITTLLLTNFTFAQGLPNLPFPLPNDTDTEAKVSISCTSRGSGSIPLNITFRSIEELENLSTGTISASGFNQYRFDVTVSDLEILEGQIRFNFKGTNIEGSYEVNLKDGKPHGVGNIDLTQKPVVGATVFNKYPLHSCSGKL